MHTHPSATGSHRGTPLTDDEKAAICLHVEDADAVWEARLRAKDMADRQAARRAEGDQYERSITGRWD